MRKTLQIFKYLVTAHKARTFFMIFLNTGFV